MVTIRVYGLLLNDEKQLLVSDEYIRGNYFTKFPGGGMEPGEGTRECLQREFLEEMNLAVEVGEHIYTTDFYLKSAFNPAYQILAIYYQVKALAPITVPLRQQAFAFDDEQLQRYQVTQQIETFRFLDWHLLSEDSVTLPLDKIALNILLNKNP